jgi:tetrapyrrole methylase family protein / MazG family protein
MVEKRGITILGLGPGNPSHLTLDVIEWLQSITEIYIRTSHHPTVSAFPKSLKVFSFDDIYDHEDTFETVYQKIVEKVLELGERPQGVTYAVPGHPMVAEATTPEIIRRAQDAGIPVEVKEGLSFLEPTFTALNIDPYPNLVLMDALDLARLHHPPYSPASPVLICQIYSRPVAADVKLTLMAVYPDEYPVRLVHAAGTTQQVIEDLKLYEIDRSEHIGLLTAMYIPPLAKETSFETFQEIVAHLRAPDGCPWDREQTHMSLRSSLLEETYEALTAMDAGDPEAMVEEFGDLLLQIVLNAQIASEDGEFQMTQVLEGISSKLVRRHPHVFGDVNVDGVKNVLSNWEKIKADERKNKKENPDKGLLDGVPVSLPSLSQAQSYQERAGRVGFDWHAIDGVFEKLSEELEEVKSAKNEQDRAGEIGDLLFSVVNLARWFKVDAESSLRETNVKFLRRFKYIEQKARDTGRQMGQMTLEEMDVWWNEAKQKE